MTSKVVRRTLPTVRAFKKFWQHEGPFKYALCSLAFPDPLLEPEEWLFGDNYQDLLKNLLQWDQRGMRLAPCSHATGDSSNSGGWHIRHLPAALRQWPCKAYTAEGCVSAHVVQAAVEATPAAIEKVFLRALRDALEQIGYQLLKPEMGLPHAYIETFLKEWQEDEAEDGGFA